MARLARDVDLGPRRLVRVRRRVVVLPQIGGMTLGAREVPVLAVVRPVQPVARLHVVVGVEMEPTLTTLLLRSRIPRDRQRLFSALVAVTGEVDQILLQRMHAERVADLVVVQLAVGSVRVDDELAVAPEERRRRPGVREFRVLEVAEHRGVARHLHCEVVIGAVPQRMFGLMATAAGFVAGVVRHGNGDWSRRSWRHRRRRRRSLVLYEQ